MNKAEKILIVLGFAVLAYTFYVEYQTAQAVDRVKQITVELRQKTQND